MAAKPSLLLFDDPTTGLDPIMATTVDEEIVKLRDLQHVTSIVVTHQIRDAFYVGSDQSEPDLARRTALPPARGRAFPCGPQPPRQTSTRALTSPIALREPSAGKSTTRRRKSRPAPP
jgi:ABC-type nitrate/sulfonate/bicarbonate transport system ATPase subunit